MADVPQYLDFRFLGQDVRNQIAHSRDILGQIEILQKTLEKIENADARNQVEASIKHLLAIVGSMSANVAVTTTSGTTTISSVTGPTGPASPFISTIKLSNDKQ